MDTLPPQAVGGSLDSACLVQEQHVVARARHKGGVDGGSADDANGHTCKPGVHPPQALNQPKNCVLWVLWRVCDGRPFVTVQWGLVCFTLVWLALHWIGSVSIGLVWRGFNSFAPI